MYAVFGVEEDRTRCYSEHFSAESVGYRLRVLRWLYHVRLLLLLIVITADPQECKNKTCTELLLGATMLRLVAIRTRLSS